MSSEGRERKIIPVRVGEVLTITPTLYAKNDPAYSMDGFMIFIRDSPKQGEERRSDDLSRERWDIRIIDVRGTYAIAKYVGSRVNVW
jgi:predicted RNA-binding protein with TRAM domain